MHVCSKIGAKILRLAALAQEDAQFSTVAASNQQLDRPAFGYYAFFDLKEWLQYGLEGWFKNIALGTNYRVDMLSDDALYEGLIGAITATFMEGPGIIMDTATSYFKGKQLTKVGVTGDQLAEIGKTMSVDIQKPPRSRLHPRKIPRSNRIPPQKAPNLRQLLPPTRIYSCRQRKFWESYHSKNEALFLLIRTSWRIYNLWNSNGRCFCSKGKP